MDVQLGLRCEQHAYHTTGRDRSQMRTVRRRLTCATRVLYCPRDGYAGPAFRATPVGVHHVPPPATRPAISPTPRSRVPMCRPHGASGPRSVSIGRTRLQVHQRSCHNDTPDACGGARRVDRLRAARLPSGTAGRGRRSGGAPRARRAGRPRRKPLAAREVSSAPPVIVSANPLGGSTVRRIIDTACRTALNEVPHMRAGSDWVR
jgi:hypothetical protein